ncbi:hypothetical protein CHARACLAT_015382 [Characodon lateralis]|uniref:Uncharacterized protein n=1 Tax=Characodon lateralis TaxID=208331 RepID=A0ABU7EA31_9TELE|nr:hypothetical protein [Characodon lateralis]
MNILDKVNCFTHLGNKRCSEAWHDGTDCIFVVIIIYPQLNIQCVNDEQPCAVDPFSLKHHQDFDDSLRMIYVNTNVKTQKHILSFFLLLHMGEFLISCHDTS